MDLFNISIQNIAMGGRKKTRKKQGGPSGVTKLTENSLKKWVSFVNKTHNIYTAENNLISKSVRANAGNKKE